MKENLKCNIDKYDYSERHDMFIEDYSQCLKIPQYYAEQPGETYFHSPMSINLFGIYNCNTDKMNILYTHLMSQEKVEMKFVLYCG